MNPAQVQQMWLASILGLAITGTVVYYAAKAGSATGCRLVRR
jgi:purine-cytosine permease-like protein